MADAALQIRSFRLVFDLERRIHHVDRFKIPVPYGLPLRSLAYAAVALVAVVVLQRLPVFGQVLGVLPAPIRLVLVPVGGAYALTKVRVDGRSAHTTAVCWLRFLLAPRCVSAFRRAPVDRELRIADLTMVGDGLGPRWQRGVVNGPATVTVRHPFRSTRRGRTLRMERVGDSVEGAGKRVHVPAGSRVVLR